MNVPKGSDKHIYEYFAISPFFLCQRHVLGKVKSDKRSNASEVREIRE
jgi:hypothetical protein